MKDKNKILLEVQLDKDKIPSDIFWTTDPEQSVSRKACKAFLLSVFDKQTKETMKIDLWTKEMQVIEMDRFFYYTLTALADTYFRATGNESLANDFRNFSQHFGEKTGLFDQT